MRKKNKGFAVMIIILGSLIIGCNKYECKKPKLVSSISSMNHEYCTIIIYKRSVQNKIELVRLLVEMCKDNDFENIKFATDVRGYPSCLSLSVYLTEKDFQKGKQYVNIRYEMIKYIKSSNIRDNPENYQLYIDNELIQIYEQS